MRIETAAGPIDPDELGATLMHEHPGSVAPAGFYSGGNTADIEELAERALACLTTYGIRSVVDLTGRARTGHDDNLTGRLASRLPVNLIAGFSFYKDPWLEGIEDDLDRLVDLYISPAIDGIRGTKVKAGIFGEVGTSLNRITPREETHLRAAARAHIATGLAISTHCTLGTMALEQVALLAEEGADLSRVIIGHLDLEPDVVYLEKVLNSGVNVAFDTFGKEWFDYRVPDSEGEGGGEFIKWAYYRPDEDRIRALVELVGRGYDDRIVLSCDMSGAEAFMNPSTHGRYGYAYLPGVVVPRLTEAGISPESLQRMLVQNPARILAVP
jgi:phosphotriesterase-related protein